MLVKEKITNILLSVNDIKDINDYKKVGVSTFLFALKDYSIGYEKQFLIDEINNVDKSIKKYVLINKLLTSFEVDSLKNIIDNLEVDGFVFEDISLINILRGKNVEKILFMNHFNCNYISVNNWLEYVDSVVISNELTYDEIKTIASMAKRKIVLNVFGYNQIMYSKRHLLKNFYDNFNINGELSQTIVEQQTNVKFKMIDEDSGTVVLSSKIFNGKRLFNIDNIKFYYINSSFINKDDILRFLLGEEVDNSDDGFLDKPTIYKLEARK